MLNFHLEPAITLLDSMRMKNQLIVQSGKSRKIITKKNSIGSEMNLSKSTVIHM